MLEKQEIVRLQTWFEQIVFTKPSNKRVLETVIFLYHLDFQSPVTSSNGATGSNASS